MKDGANKKSWLRLFQIEGGNIFQGKKIIIIIVILVFAIFLMQIDNLIGRKEERKDETGEQIIPVTKEELQYADIEHRLELILSKMKDVGSVSVMLTYKDSTEYKYAETTEKTQKTTVETDQQGGSREITESQENSQIVLARSNQGGEEAILLQEIKPNIKGVIIVAQGAQNPKIKEEIIRAAQSVLGIGIHRITVLLGEKREG